jgi:hypothetical protein
MLMYHCPIFFYSLTLCNRLPSAAAYACDNVHTAPGDAFGSRLIDANDSNDRMYTAIRRRHLLATLNPIELDFNLFCDHIADNFTLQHEQDGSSYTSLCIKGRLSRCRPMGDDSRQTTRLFNMPRATGPVQYNNRFTAQDRERDIIPLSNPPLYRSCLYTKLQHQQHTNHQP